MRLFPLLLLFVSVAQAQSPGATYRVSFLSTWSAATHPDAFPPNPHFSGLVGATHDASVRFWKTGESASAGIESMAETGSKTLLLAEIAAAGSAIGSVLSGGGIALSPGSVDLSFDITRERPLVTLVSMVAPSPDWFVGVMDLDLRDGAGWKSRVEAELHVYDAGTDDGATYTAPNADTVPRGLIAPLAEPPFQTNGRMGTFVFELLATTGTVEAPDLPGRTELGVPWPNPAVSTVHVGVGPGARAVQLMDVLGRLIERIALADDSETAIFDVSGLVPGVYFLHIEGGRSRAVIVAR